MRLCAVLCFNRDDGVCRDRWHRTRMVLGLGGFGLEEGDGGSGGVGEDGGPAYVGDLHGAVVDGGTEGFGFFGGGVDVIYADIGEPHGGSSGHGEDAAAGTGVGLEGGVDHVAHVVVGVGPAEELAVEVFSFGDVGG
jgi:hypothetical protein